MNERGGRYSCQIASSHVGKAAPNVLSLSAPQTSRPRSAKEILVESIFTLFEDSANSGKRWDDQILDKESERTDSW